MPRADITDEYRSDAGQSKFPRLKLQLNERARVVVVSSPQTEYVHRLEAPNIVNMAPTYKKIKDKDGNDQYVVEKRFVSAPLCFGDYNTLRERGVDDKNCLACLAARDRPDIFRSPQPKYAANILRYNLRPGGGWNDIASPYGVNALIWVFGGKIMDKLIDIRTMGPAYADIRLVDLLLECTDTNYQKPYSNGEFLPATPAVWASNDQVRNYTAQYLAANGATEEDLTAAIGKRVKQDWLSDDLSRCIQRWEVVRAAESRQGGMPQMGPQGFGAETLQQGMAGVQQQYAGNGQQVNAANGYGGQGGSSAPPGGYQQQPSAGVDMSLMGGNFQAPPPPPPPQQGFVPPGPQGYAPQGLNTDALLAAQQAAQQGQNPVAAAYETQTGETLPPGTGQWQPPGHEGDMFTPPTPPVPAAAGTTGVSETAAPASVPAPPTLGGTASSVTAPDLGAAPATSAAPVTAASPPQGLSGLNEFMASTTSNPSMEAQPSVPHEQLTTPPPPAPPSSAPALPAGGSWTFDDLAKAAGKNP